MRIRHLLADRTQVDDFVRDGTNSCGVSQCNWCILLQRIEDLNNSALCKHTLLIRKLLSPALARVVSALLDSAPLRPTVHSLFRMFEEHGGTFEHCWCIRHSEAPFPNAVMKTDFAGTSSFGLQNEDSVSRKVHCLPIKYKQIMTSPHGSRRQAHSMVRMSAPAIAMCQTPRPSGRKMENFAINNNCASQHIYI